jgi:RNA polymerase sigma-70 factor (ECF subfamily)
VHETDEDLMLRAKDGDLDAFETLVERLKVFVYSLTVHILRSREDAEEAAQDTFVKLFRARTLYQPGRAVVPWVLRIASNSARDLARRRRVHQRSGAVRLEESPTEPVDPRGTGSGRHQIEPEEVQALLSNLSESYRLPLVLKYFQNLSNQEIADALGISLSNIKVKLARARELVLARLRTMQGK